MSNRTSIKYPGTTTRTSKVHINNMYIKYTFDIASFLIRQVLVVVALPMTFSLAVETHSVWLRTSLGLHRHNNRLAARATTDVPLFLKCPFLALAFLKLVVLLTINT